MRKLNVMLTPLAPSISSFEFDDGTTRWRACAAIVNSEVANDETANAWRAAA